MAKAKSSSRSDAIRRYLSANPEGRPQAVVAALKEKGIDVKVGLVSNVKHRLNARKSRRGASERRRKVVERPAITGTQAIRTYLKDHPMAGPKEIREALAGQGVKVSGSLVSAVKYRKRRRRAPAVRVAARRAASTNGAVTVEQLIELKRFADSFGGITKVRRILDLLMQLL